MGKPLLLSAPLNKASNQRGASTGGHSRGIPPENRCVSKLEKEGFFKKAWQQKARSDCYLSLLWNTNGERERFRVPSVTLTSSY